jgi:hypothetical protein
MLALRLSAGRRRPHRWERELTMSRSSTEVAPANPPATRDACASSASIALPNADLLHCKKHGIACGRRDRIGL